MGTLAERLEPPFYAAVLKDRQSDGLSADQRIDAVDELVSRAPGQPGFLGLETAKDNSGNQVTVSYWKATGDVETWRSRTEAELINRGHDGGEVQASYRMRVSLIDQKVRTETAGDEAAAAKTDLRAELPAMPRQSHWTVGAVLMNSFPAIAELLGYEHA